MLNVTCCTSAAAAKGYFRHPDYYLDGQESPGTWHGRGAAALGLSGVVREAEFAALCDNVRPDTGERLTVRTKAERRVGYDLTFNAPKSVSLAYELTGDEAILAAFRDAVRDTMAEVEAGVKVRVRREGKSEDREAGTAVWAEFVHRTARPVNGVPDPHLHCHAFLFNATFDPEEQRWKAAQLGDVKRHARYYEALFHAHLAERMTDLGYAVKRTNARDWEVAGFADPTLRAFSRRRAVIEEAIAEQGIPAGPGRGEVARTTREAKRPGLTIEQLRAEWVSRLTDTERESLARLKSHPRPDGVTLAEAKRHAVLHLFERASVVPETAFLEAVLRRGYGSVSVAQAKTLLADPDLIRRELGGEQVVTTREVLQEERAVLKFARAGRGSCKPLDPADRRWTRTWLDVSQKQAIRHVLSSQDRVLLIRGVAGAGKTSLLQEAAEAIRVAGHRVLAFAPSAAASRGVLRADGFADADTLAKFLVDPNLQAEAHGAVLVIDEAGLVGMKDTKALFEIAAKSGSRVVLVGDAKQHKPVARGDAFRLLHEVGGLPVAEVTGIKRQSGEYKAAVEALAAGDVSEGFRRLDDLGWVVEGTHADLADAYAKTLAEGKSALVVCPTHAEGDRLTDVIRDRLRTDGRLQGEDRDVAVWVPRPLTEAERADSLSYSAGDVLRFVKNGAGHRSGDVVRVEDPARVPTEAAGSFAVFREKTVRLAVGDEVRATANTKASERSSALHNGSVYRVVGFTPNGGVALDNGAVVPAAAPFLDRGYVVTSHAAQGRKADRVFVSQRAESFPASGRDQFYVSASRGVEQVLVVTDDKAALREAIDRLRDRRFAVEADGSADQYRDLDAQRSWRQRWQWFRERLAERVRNLRGRSRHQEWEQAYG